jgi:hypothetical protein
LPELLSLWEQQYAESLGPEIAALRASLVLLLFSIQEDCVLNNAMLQESLAHSAGVVPDFSLDNLSGLAGLALYSELRSILLRRWEDQCH